MCPDRSNEIRNSISMFADLDNITANMAEFIVRPPIVQGTLQKYIDAIRCVHARSANLFCFEYRSRNIS